MDQEKDVMPINSLAGKTVLSLATGNKLGAVEDLFIDPLNGLLLGFSVGMSDGTQGGISYQQVYSFGHDAIMVSSEDVAQPLEQLGFAASPHSSDLVGTKIITVSGNLLGQIVNVFVTLKPPPLIVYAVRDSMLDKLLGREFYILAASGHALSDDRERLVVPDETAATGSATIADLINKRLFVQTFDPAGHAEQRRNTDRRDQDITEIVTGEDDDTVVKMRRA